MVNADNLGAKGEAHFEGICADVGLFCNRPHRDRTGWDVIVEFPIREEGRTSLDARPKPLSCHVQVKTILSRTTDIRMRLSSAELLEGTEANLRLRAEGR